MDCSVVSSPDLRIHSQTCSWMGLPRNFPNTVPWWELLRTEDGICSAQCRASGPSRWTMCAISVFTMGSLIVQCSAIGMILTPVTYRIISRSIISLKTRINLLGVFNSRWFRACPVTKTKNGTTTACVTMSMASPASTQMSLIWKILCKILCLLSLFFEGRTWVHYNYHWFVCFNR